MRQLATIRQIKGIRSIPEADSIELAIVDGWECVVKKNQFNVLDNVVYIEIDSIVPERPEFEFLRDRKFRVRTIKLRGQISQGLVLPMSILSKKNHKLGDDVTKELEIVKYDPEAEQERKNSRARSIRQNKLAKTLMRFKIFRIIREVCGGIVKRIREKTYGNSFPNWIMKTDENRIQNMLTTFSIALSRGIKFSVTEKLDGQSATFFLRRRGKREKYEFGICSRNLRLPKDNGSSWWTIAKQIKAEEVLTSLARSIYAKSIVLQGEIIGEGVQGNKYKIKGLDFYAFNLIIDGIKQRTATIRDIFKPYDIKTVPILDDNFQLKDSVKEMVEYAKGNSVLAKIKREGIVVRSLDRRISFKVINPDFLLQEKD